MGRILQYDGFGIQIYLKELLQALSRIDHDHQMYVLVDPSQSIDPLPEDPRFKIVRLKPDTKTSIGKMLWDHLAVGAFCKKIKASALLAPCHVRPAYAPCPSVVVVYDMMYHLFPGDWSLSERFYFGTMVPILTKKARKILTISENSKNDIARLIGYPPENIEVAYPGVPSGFSLSAEAGISEICEKYKVRRPFILYVGGYHPRKNVPRLLDAFHRIADRVPHQLVCVGPLLWDFKHILDLVGQSQFAGRIKVTGLIPRDHIAAMLREADAFVYPSQYEGFGLPVLEALACGCPTIASKTSSISEITGDAACLIDPENIAELADAMFKLLTEPILREQLRKKGLQQSERFNWETTARQTLTLMENAAMS
jgi:glycosyltransferase involved in cell wall biosynthesis